MATACKTTNAENAATSTESQVVAKQEVLLIDVRTPEEYGQGHLTNAINIPHDQIAAKITEMGVSKDTQIQVYCRSGRRSALAQEALNNLGYNKVENLGAYSDLIKKAQ
ncbi:hypothetical protein A4G18_02270 [Pasteurellaceae bacterium Pebbles2]|nr:hypothetical protein [Pasteurellaceae bacterium Pebbles2]